LPDLKFVSYKEYLFQRLFWLPFKFGIDTAKYLNPNAYMELGMIFARRSSSFVYYHNFRTNGHATGLPTISLYSIGFPFKYYKYVGQIFKKQMWAYGVITDRNWENMPCGASTRNFTWIIMYP
jgi:hypothetical protein